MSISLTSRAFVTRVLAKTGEGGGTGEISGDEFGDKCGEVKGEFRLGFEDASRINFELTKSSGFFSC